MASIKKTLENSIISQSKCRRVIAEKDKFILQIIRQSNSFEQRLKLALDESDEITNRLNDLQHRFNLIKNLTKKKSNQILDLAMLVRRLAVELKKHEPDNKTRENAIEYLSKHGLQGDPLRDDE